tara:strand:- start:978 stop:1448 length:471 start_codon:yes stop_codon:yes gene_type:complete
MATFEQAISGASAGMESSDVFENIWVASTNGDLARVAEFLGSGVNVNAQDENGFSPIHAAASYGQLPLIEFLIGHSADVNLRDIDGDTPILVCEDQTTFELLERNGADINAKNSEGFGLAERAVALAEEENEDMVTFLFNRGFLPVDFKVVQETVE